MKRWKPSSKNVFGWLLTAHLIALWAYGMVNLPGHTLVIATLCGLWAWRCWPDETG